MTTILPKARQSFLSGRSRRMMKASGLSQTQSPRTLSLRLAEYDACQGCVGTTSAQKMMALSLSALMTARVGTYAKLCDEVFGNRKFCQMFVWKRNRQRRNDAVTGLATSRVHPCLIESADFNEFASGTEEQTPDT